MKTSDEVTVGPSVQYSVSLLGLGLPSSAAHLREMEEAGGRK